MAQACVRTQSVRVLCLVGANAEAQLVGVKSIDESEGPDYDSMDLDELREASLALIDGIDTKAGRPIQVARFEC